MRGPSWYRELHDAVARLNLFNIVSLHCQHNLKGICIGLVNKGVDSEGWDEFGGDAVVHDSEFAVRWPNFQRSIDIKLTRIHSLMEIAVIKHDKTHIRVSLPDYQILWKR